MNKVTIYVCNKEYKVDKELWYSIENLINKYINNIINLQQRIDKAIELLEKENYHCPMSLTVEKAYIIEVEKINNVISILRGGMKNK